MGQDSGVEPLPAGADETPTRHGDDDGPSARDLGAEQPFRLGRYTVLRRLGAGGMGVVYAAYDDELDRRVALKLVHVDRTGGSLGRARMLREAQSLARLSHPNVVQVYDVGAVDGRVYLAMELLDGMTLRAWRKGHERSWREVVAVYLQAGRGLAAAHAAGLVHRDFKPDNAILGGDGRVRVLDFGLARAHDPEASGARVAAVPLRASWALLAHDRWPIIDGAGLSEPLTEAGTLLGTPAYMSPEQLLRGPADARSDQFSFCVALWEALYGARPFLGRTIADLAPAVADGPPRPPRGAAPAAIGRALRRGLSLEPDERYPGMAELLAAIDAAAQRGRRWLLAGAAVAAVLAASAGGYAVAGTREQAPRCDAATALAGVWDPGSREAARAAVLAAGGPLGADAWAVASRRLDAYAHDLQGMLHRACQIRQAGALAAEVQALHEACLERRAGELAAVTGVLRAADGEAVRGAVQATLGLGPLARCGDLAALRAEAEQVPPPDGEAAEAVAALRVRLAAARAEMDAGRFVAAREAAAAIVREAERIGYAPLHAEALHRLGSAQSSTADYEGARDSLHRAFALAEAARHDASAAAVAVLLVHLHGVRLREPQAALTWRELAEAKLRRIGERGALRVQLLNHVGATLVAADKLAEGIEHYRQALALAATRKAEAPLEYGRVLNTLGTALTDLGRLDEAEQLLREALALRQRHLGAHHPDVSVIMHNLGKLSLQRGDDATAIALFRRALAIRERSLGSQHPAVADTLGGLAVMLCNAGRHAECLGHLRRTLAIVEAARGPDDPALVLPLSNVGSALVDVGDFAGATAYLERARAIVAARGDEATSDGAMVFLNLGRLALARDDPAAAIEPLKRSLALHETIFGPAHLEVGNSALMLARALARGGRPDEAAEAVRRAQAILAANPVAAAELARARLIEAELLWRRDRQAARALAESAAAALDPADVAQASVRDEIAAWLRSQVK